MPPQQVGRLALRREGEYWNAYYALNDSMEGAVLLGSINLRIVGPYTDIEQRFIELMQQIITKLFEEKFGVRATWGEPENAPEHERSEIGMIR